MAHKDYKWKGQTLKQHLNSQKPSDFCHLCFSLCIYSIFFEPAFLCFSSPVPNEHDTLSPWFYPVKVHPPDTRSDHLLSGSEGKTAWSKQRQLGLSHGGTACGEIRHQKRRINIFQCEKKTVKRIHISWLSWILFLGDVSCDSFTLLVPPRG